MGNLLPPVNGSQPYPASSSASSNNTMPGNLKTPGGLVLNFFGSNFTGSTEGANNTPGTSAQGTMPTPTQNANPLPLQPQQQPQPATVPYWPTQSIYPQQQSALSPANGVPNGVPTGDVTGMAPSDQLNALYGKYNDAQRQQDVALKAVKDAEDARNAYMAMGNQLRSQMAPKAPTQQAASLPNTPAAPANLPDAIGTPTANNANAMAAMPQGPQTPAALAPRPGLTPEQQALAEQALQQTGVPATQDGATPAQPAMATPTSPEGQPSAAATPATANPAEPNANAANTNTGAPNSPQPPSVTPAGTAPATQGSLSGANPTTLNNTLFSAAELVQFKKLSPQEQVNWITQRNLQPRADAIGEIAIQSGLASGNKFPKETYDRLETIANLDVKDVKGPAGEDLSYFVKTAIWALGLLNNSQQANTPVAQLPGIKSLEAIARNPKQNTDIRVAAAQSLRAMNRSNDPTMRQILKRIDTNQKSVIKPWTYLRPSTPGDVRQNIDAALKGIPIQQNPSPGAEAASAPTGNVAPSATAAPASLTAA
jgi:hypothetical protein